jgi:hypothetical protein
VSKPSRRTHGAFAGLRQDIASPLCVLRDAPSGLLRMLVVVHRGADEKKAPPIVLGGAFLFSAAYFSAPAVRPLTILRCRSMKTMTIGVT